MARRKSTSKSARIKSNYSSKISIDKLKKSKYNRKTRTPKSYSRGKRRQQEQAKVHGAKEKAARQSHVNIMRYSEKRAKWQSPSMLLKWVGSVFLLIGIIGFVTPQINLAGYSMLQSAAESYTLTIVGFISIALSMWPKRNYQKWFTVIIGLGGLFFAITGFLVLGQPELNYYGIAHLDLIDNLIFLGVGLWALVAVKRW